MHRGFASLLEGLARLYYFLGEANLEVASEYFVDTNHYLRFDPMLGWSLKPGYNDNDVSVNAIGLRSSLDDIEADCRGKRRILLLGDSMLFGYGMPQHLIFSEILNDQSEECCFINTGVEGYSTVQEYLVASTHMERLAPDHVVLFYTQENDMWWNARDGNFNPSATLRGDSLEFFVPQRRREVPYYKKTALHAWLNRHFLHGKDLVYIYQKVDFQLRREDSEVWRVTARVLERLIAMMTARGAGFTLIDVPTQNQLSGRADDRTRQQLLRSLAVRLGVEYFDLERYYIADSQQLFRMNDSHWNETGHQFIADLINRAVIDELRVPERFQ